LPALKRKPCSSSDSYTSQPQCAAKHALPLYFFAMAGWALRLQHSPGRSGKVVQAYNESR